MADEEVKKLKLAYSSTELPALLASIKSDTQLQQFILQYAEAKGTSLTETQVNNLIATYIQTNNIGTGGSQGTGLTTKQTEKLAKILTNGTGDKFLSNDGTYKTGGYTDVSKSVNGDEITLTFTKSDGTTKSVSFNKSGSGSGTVTTYTVTNRLTNATSDNTNISVSEGSSYTANITAGAGHTLTGATVSITMGGTDITSTAYSNGVVTISNVTGNIIIDVTTAEESTTTVTGTMNSNRVISIDGLPTGQYSLYYEDESGNKLSGYEKLTCSSESYSLEVE